MTHHDAPSPTPSQPAHGEALTEADPDRERDVLADVLSDCVPIYTDTIACRCHGIVWEVGTHFWTHITAQQMAAVAVECPDRLAAQPAHGDSEAALRAVEAELSQFTRRGVASDPQWPWRALDRARAALSASAEPEGDS